MEPAPSFDGQEGPSVRSGYRLPLDALIAPRRAFAAIAATREWTAAYIVAVGLGLVGIALIAPALIHVSMKTLAALPGPHAPADIAREARNGIYDQIFQRIASPIASWWIAALIMTMLSRPENGRRAFAAFYSLQANCGIPPLIGAVAFGVAIRLHDPLSYTSFGDLSRALPISLASLRPNGNLREVAFLSYWDVFTLWTLLLTGYGYAAIAKSSLLVGLFIAFAIGLGFAVLQSLPVPRP